MELGLRGRTAVVTGGARGIGFEEASMLLDEGCRVAIVDLDADPAERARAALSARGTVVAYQGDAASEADVQRVLGDVRRDLGPVQILVNNAGIGVKPAHAVAQMPLAAWQQMLQVHLDSTFLWSKAVIDDMRGAGYGRIVNTSSMNFTGGGRPGVSHYAAAKAGIAGFTRTLAKEVGAFGITANAVAPGYVETDLIAGFTTERRKRIERQNPMGRMCRPEEVAAAVAFLCSARAGFINGALLCIDGGRRDFVWED